MNAVTQTPILDRVRDFMRDAASARSLNEVLSAFPGETAAVVRLSLGALRKQMALDGWIEGNMPFYIWRGAGKSHRPAVPVAGFQPRDSATPAPPGARDALLQAMKDGGRYTISELVKDTGFPRETTNRLLNDLASKGVLSARGRTSGRTYQLADVAEPMPRIARAPKAVAVPAVRLLAVANEPQEFALGGSADVETRIASTESAALAPAAPLTDDELRLIGVPERLIAGPTQRHQPSFGYFNDGSLYVDARYCQGYLERGDLAALRVFLNEMFLPTEKST